MNAAKGYNKTATLVWAEERGIRTYIPEAEHKHNRRWDDKPESWSEACYENRRRVARKRGKALQHSRSEFVARGGRDAGRNATPQPVNRSSADPKLTFSWLLPTCSLSIGRHGVDRHQRSQVVVQYGALRHLCLAPCGPGSIMTPPEVMSAKTLKFLVVGGINTAIFYCVYVFLLWLGCHYSLALIVEYCGGIVTGYAMNRRWTFASQGCPQLEFTRYLVTYAGVFLLNMALLAGIVESGLLGPAAGQAAAMAIAAAVSFGLQNCWVFRRSTPL